MATCVVNIRVHVQPWVRWYIKAIVCFAEATGMEPDMEKVARMVRHGVKATLVPCSR